MTDDAGLQEKAKSMRAMALDVGEKTVGIAVSDELGRTVSPRETLRRDGQEFQTLARLVKNEEIGNVVVGMPISLNGTLGPSAERVQKFLAELRPLLTIPVVTWDERLTTAEAEKMLIAADMRRQKRRKVIDQVAAVLILEGYLRHQSFQSNLLED